MDKAEYKIRLDQMSRLAAAGDFTEAAKIADTIDWRKVKSVRILCMVAEIYEKTGRLDDSWTILNYALKSSRGGKMVVYRMAELALKLGDLEDAEHYCGEFERIAPHDTGRYILKYQLLKASGAPLDEQIAILKEYKDREYTERWAYELAELYKMNGEDEKCIEECDDLILWFSDGSYVTRAMELKMTIRPLTTMQRKLYDNRFNRASSEGTDASLRRDNGGYRLRDGGTGYTFLAGPDTKAPRMGAAQAIEKMNAAAGEALNTSRGELRAPTVVTSARSVFGTNNEEDIQQKLADSIREVFAGIRTPVEEPQEEAEETMEKAIVYESPDFDAASVKALEPENFGATDRPVPAAETAPEEPAEAAVDLNALFAETGSELAAQVVRLKEDDDLAAAEADAEEAAAAEAAKAEEAAKAAAEEAAVTVAAEAVKAEEAATAAAEGAAVTVAAEAAKAEEAAKAAAEEAAVAVAAEAEKAEEAAKATAEEAAVAVAAEAAKAEEAATAAAEGAAVAVAAEAEKAEEASTAAAEGAAVAAAAEAAKAEEAVKATAEEAAVAVAAEAAEAAKTAAEEVVQAEGAKTAMDYQPVPDHADLSALDLSEAGFADEARAAEEAVWEAAAEEALLEMIAEEEAEAARTPAAAAAPAKEEDGLAITEVNVEEALSSAEAAEEAPQAIGDTAPEGLAGTGIAAASIAAAGLASKTTAVQAATTEAAPAQMITETTAEASPAGMMIKAAAEPATAAEAAPAGMTIEAAAEAAPAGMMTEAAAEPVAAAEAASAQMMTKAAAAALAAETISVSAGHTPGAQPAPETVAAASAGSAGEATDASPAAAYAPAAGMPAPAAPAADKAPAAGGPASEPTQAALAAEDAGLASDGHPMTPEEAELDRKRALYKSLFEKETDESLGLTRPFNFQAELRKALEGGASLQEAAREVTQKAEAAPVFEDVNLTESSYLLNPETAAKSMVMQADTFDYTAARPTHPDTDSLDALIEVALKRREEEKMAAALYEETFGPQDDYNEDIPAELFADEEDFRREEKAVGTGVLTDISTVSLSEEETSKSLIDHIMERPEIIGRQPLTPRKLDETEAKVLSYFAKIPGVGDQVTVALADVHNNSGDRTSRTGNILLMGRQGAGKTRLADSLILLICKDLDIRAAKIGKIVAEDFNQKDPASIVSLLAGGFLVIEGAGGLSEESIDGLNRAMEFRTDDLVVILEDEKADLRQLTVTHPDFAAKFTSSITVPVFTNDELVAFARTYAREMGYRMDDMGTLALYTIIGQNQKYDEPVTVGKVKEMMDKAIEKASRHRLARRFSRKGTDPSGRIYLREKDFED